MHEQLEDLTTRLPIVGYTVFWRLSGIVVDQADLLAALHHTQFAAYTPDPPTAAKALRRALAAWLAARGAQHGLVADDEADESAPQRPTATARRALIRVINKRRSAYMVFALIAEDIDFRKLGLSYGTQLRILLDKATDRIICTTEAAGVIEAEDEAQQLAAELRPYWAAYQHRYLASDLSRMVRAIVVDQGAISVRQGGGVYFVPAAYGDALTRLRTLLDMLPTDGRQTPFLVMLGVPDEPESRRQLSRAVHAGFVDELTAMDADLDDLRGKAKTISIDTIAKRLTAFKALRDKAHTYADLLGMQQETITEQLAALTTKAQALLLDAGDEDADGELADADAPLEQPRADQVVTPPSTDEGAPRGAEV